MRELVALAEEIRSCRGCIRRHQARRPVPGVGKVGNTMFVGQAPGWVEDREGVPFVGDAGQFLDAHLTLAGITDYFITNCCHCYPGRAVGGDAAPPAKAMQTCQHFLEREIKLVKPRLIVAIGAIAMRWFGIPGGIQKNAGRVFDTHYGPVLPILHPAGVMRRLNEVPALATSFHSINTALRGPDTPPPFTDTFVATEDTAGVDIETQDDQIWCVGTADSLSRGAEQLWGFLPNDTTPVFHNARFDISYLEREGLRIPQWEDTILQAHLLGYKPLNLPTLSAIFNGVPLNKTFVKQRKQVRYEEHPEEVLEGCSMDAWATYNLNKLFQPRIAPWQSIYEKEKQITRILMGMGSLPISQERLKMARRNILQRMGQLEAELESLGLDSPGDVEEVGRKFWKGKKKIVTTKTGRLETRKDTLLLRATPEQLVWVNPLLEHRSLSKFTSTYLDNWAGQDWIRPSLNQTGTISWRFSCSDPNLQNVPKLKTVSLYQLFVAPPGHVFLSADYRQAELVMLANASEDSEMIRTFLAGEDIHDNTVTRWKLLERFKDIDYARRFAKTVNFGIMYGITPFGLAPRLRTSQDEAALFIDDFYATYPGTRAWQERQIEHAEEKGYVTTFTGRPLWVPGIYAERGALRAHAEKQCMNLPIQGGIAEVVKDAMLRAPKYLVMQVHDELLYLVPENEAEDYKLFLEETLPDHRHPVPYQVEVTAGKTWGDIKHQPDVWYEEEA